MRQTLSALLVVLALASVATSSLAAPVDIIVRQDSNSGGPLPSWSLLLDVEAGYEVGGIGILVTGLDVFTINAANPGIGVLDSVYNTHAPLDAEFSLRVELAGPVGAIPEPPYLGWISLPIAGLMIAQACRSRSRAVTRPV